MQLYFCIVNGPGTETLCTGESITLPFTKFIVKNTAYWNPEIVMMIMIDALKF